MISKIRTVILTLCVILLLYLGINKFNNYIILTYQPYMKTQFVRIYDTGGYQDLGEGELVYYESFVIINAPEDSKKLKETIDKYEATLEPRESDYEKCDKYQRIYIKESHKLSRNWKPSWDCPSEDCAYGKIVCRTTIVKATGELVYNLTPLNSEFHEVSRERIVEQKYVGDC